MKYQAIRQSNSGQWCVKVRKGAKWYTVVECYCVPGIGDAREVAEVVANFFNTYQVQNEVSKLYQSKNI